MNLSPYCYLFNNNIILIVLAVIPDYLVDPAGSCHPVNKLTTLAWKPIHASVVSLRPLSSRN